MCLGRRQVNKTYIMVISSRMAKISYRDFLGEARRNNAMKASKLIYKRFIAGMQWHRRERHK